MNPDPDQAPKDLAPAAPVARDHRAVLTKLEEVRAYVAALARSAERNLVIYGHTLEAGIYERPEFLDALKRLVLARPYARVRVLLASAVVDETHPLMRMATRLPSLIEIRRLDPKQDDASAFVVADARAVVYRMHCQRWDGMAELQNPLIAKLYLDKFEQAWANGLRFATAASGNAHVAGSGADFKSDEAVGVPAILRPL